MYWYSDYRSILNRSQKLQRHARLPHAVGLVLQEGSDSMAAAQPHLEQKHCQGLTTSNQEL